MILHQRVDARKAFCAEKKKCIFRCVQSIREDSCVESGNCRESRGEDKEPFVETKEF